MGHEWTYSGHPLDAAAGLATLDILEWESLTENAREAGANLQQQFLQVFDNNPLVGEVRGVGLIGSLEFVAEKTKSNVLTQAGKSALKFRRRA